MYGPAAEVTREAYEATIARHHARRRWWTRWPWTRDTCRCGAHLVCPVGEARRGDAARNQRSYA
jgi:hypothetical protein